MFYIRRCSFFSSFFCFFSFFVVRLLCFSSCLEKARSFCSSSILKVWRNFLSGSTRLAPTAASGRGDDVVVLKRTLLDSFSCLSPVLGAVLACLGLTRLVSTRLGGVCTGGLNRYGSRCGLACRGLTCLESILVFCLCLSKLVV